MQFVSELDFREIHPTCAVEKAWIKAVCREWRLARSALFGGAV